MQFCAQYCLRFVGAPHIHSTGSSLRGFLSLAVVVFAAWFAVGGRLAEAQITVPIDYRNYAIIGGSKVSFLPYATVLGDVYGAGDITLGFGYGIQKPALNVGNFYTRANFTLSSSFSETANVAANGYVSVTSGTLVGNVQFGTTVSGAINGTKTQVPNSVPVVNLPTTPAFTFGTQNITETGDLVLQPGSYGDISFSGFYTSLTLSSGDYYLKSLNASSTHSVQKLNLNLTNGPIRIHSDGDIAFGTALDVFVNGVKINPNASTPQADGILAGNVLFESNHNISVGGFTGSFVGTLLAPNGTVTLDTQAWYGSVLAGGDISAKGYLIKESYNFGGAAVPLFGAAATSVIVGGSGSIPTALTNLAPAGGSALDFTATGQVISGGITLDPIQPSTGSVPPGAAATLAIPLTATQLGPARLAVNITDPNAYTPNSTGFLNVTVLDHASPVTTPTFARAMHGSVAFGSASIQNLPTSYRADLQVTDGGGLLDITPNTLIANGAAKYVRAPVDSSSYGPATATLTAKVSDDKSLIGAVDLPDLQVTVSANILDDRRVSAAGVADLGFVHTGKVATGTATLTSIGADEFFTRITVNNSTAADSNGISVSGATNGFQFGFNGLSTTRSVGGTPNKLGLVNGTINLTTVGESNIPGNQVLANVAVPYSVKVYTGQASWNGSTGGVWSDHPSWADNLSNAGGGSPGISGINGDSATFGNTIGGNPVSIALNGNNPSLGSLTFDNNLGGSFTIGSGNGGAITINAPVSGTAVMVNNGSHRISAPIALTGKNTIAVYDAQGALTIDGALTSTTGITKTGPGTLALTSASNNLGPVTISAGTVSGNVASLKNSIVNNGALVFDQPIDATFTGTVTGSGSITKAGLGRLTLAGIDNFSASAPLTVAGGSLAIPLGLPRAGAGIQLVAGGMLEAANSVPRSVAGTGTLLATDDLTIGRSDQLWQFNLGGAANIGGTLIVDNHAVVVLSRDTAILGSLTAISDHGSLTTLHGAQLGYDHTLDTTKVLSVSGNATVNGDFINNGLVNGPAQIEQWLTFTQDVRGAGNTTGNVLYAGSYSPGNSAAIISAENLLFDATSTLLMEIGGPNPGQYDQVQVSRLASLDGTLNLSLLGDYSLESGHAYQLLAGPYSGQFDHVVGMPNGWHLEYRGELVNLTSNFPGDANYDGIVDFTDLNMLLTNYGLHAPTSSMLSPVPEPSTFALAAFGTLGLLIAARRKR